MPTPPLIDQAQGTRPNRRARNGTGAQSVSGIRRRRANPIRRTELRKWSMTETISKMATYRPERYGPKKRLEGAEVADRRRREVTDNFREPKVSNEKKKDAVLIVVDFTS